MLDQVSPEPFLGYAAICLDCRGNSHHALSSSLSLAPETQGPDLTTSHFFLLNSPDIIVSVLLIKLLHLHQLADRARIQLCVCAAVLSIYQNLNLAHKQALYILV